MEQTIEQIQELISNNQIEPAINKLKSVFSISESVFVNDAILISGQYKKLLSDIEGKKMDYTQENLRHSTIMYSILSLLDEIRQDPESFREYDETERKLDESLMKKGYDILPMHLKNSLFERIAYVKEKKVDMKILWIDDFPQNNYYEARLLEKVGLTIEFARTSEEGLAFLSKNEFDLVISDISRGEKAREGLDFHLELISKGIDLPYIFYTGSVDRSRGVPPFAFGIASLPNDLAHLVMDVVERKH